MLNAQLYKARRKGRSHKSWMQDTQEDFKKAGHEQLDADVVGPCSLEMSCARDQGPLRAVAPEEEELLLDKFCNCQFTTGYKLRLQITKMSTINLIT